MRVLIVEDEKDLLSSTTDYLKQSGMSCEQAINLKQGLDKVDQYNYDCIVLDIGLPDGSGLKIIEEMKKKNVQTGLVIVSAKNSLDDRLTGLNMGADDYIVKPFHMPELVARINSVFRRRSLQGKK